MLSGCMKHRSEHRSSISSMILCLRRYSSAFSLSVFVILYFVTEMASTMTYSQLQECLEGFRNVSKGKDYIESGELLTIFKFMGLTLSESELRDLKDSRKISKRRMIHLHDFLKLIARRNIDV
jgi:Ca2+-binding EF-hand superfamily protein